MKDLWRKFRALPWWKQTLGWVGGTIALLFVAGTIGAILDPPVETQETAEQQPEEPQKQDVAEPEEEPEPTRLSPAQTFSRIYDDRNEWCETRDLRDRAFERRLFRGNHEMMAEDLPPHVAPATAEVTFSYVWDYCHAQLEPLSVGEAVDRIYGDGQDWCASFLLAGGDEEERRLRGIFRGAYEGPSRELYEEGYSPPPASAVFSELASRC